MFTYKKISVGWKSPETLSGDCGGNHYLRIKTVVALLVEWLAVLSYRFSHDLTCFFSRISVNTSADETIFYVFFLYFFLLSEFLVDFCYVAQGSIYFSIYLLPFLSAWSVSKLCKNINFYWQMFSSFIHLGEDIHFGEIEFI